MTYFLLFRAAETAGGVLGCQQFYSLSSSGEKTVIIGTE